MIGFADFVPRLIEEGGVFHPEERALVQEAVDRANQWISQNKVQVLNIETVVMPNIFAAGEKGPQDSSVAVWDYHRWYQFVRVWYTYGAEQ
jgi:hypothetical protein